MALSKISSPTFAEVHGGGNFGISIMNSTIITIHACTCTCTCTCMHMYMHAPIKECQCCLINYNIIAIYTIIYYLRELRLRNPSLYYIKKIMAILKEFDNEMLYIYVLYIPVYVLYFIFPIAIISASVCTVFTTSLNRPVAAAWRAIINITLLGGLKSETTENGRKRYSLFDYPVTPGYVRAVGIFTIALWISLLATFWLNFIIEVTEECRVGIDCFSTGKNSSRIGHCCDVDGVNEAIHCYEFQFDFINGAGTAGGLLTITVTILYGQLSAQAWLETKKGKSKTKRKKMCYKALFILLGAIPLTVVILLNVLSVIKIFNAGGDDFWSQLSPLFKAVFNLFPLLIISSHPLFKKTRLSTDPEAGSPGRGLYTCIEDGHVSINEGQPMITRAHTTQ